jgi:ABC-type transporter Mla subunit MlaD
MKPNLIRTTLRLLGAGTLTLGVVACASSGPSRSAKAVDTMDETHAGLTKVRTQIDRTLDSLREVMSASPERLRPSFDRYSKDVDRLRAESAQTRKRFEGMKTKRNDYLEAWQKEQGGVRDPELRQLGEDRRSEVRANLDRMVESLTVANERFDPFLSNLGDVQKVLGNDLTPAGQTLVAGSAVVQNASDNGSRVARSIDVALEALSNVAGRLSSTGEMKK